jgi:parallel beta-helix repeat protein
MKNGFLMHLAAKIRRNKLKWRVASAMLAAIALLFAFQGFTRADDDDDHNHDAKAITDCSAGTFVINTRGRYFLAKDLSQCAGIIISITVSDVKLELRGHTIVGDQTNPVISVSAPGGGAVLSNIEIAGPGTVTGGITGIDLEDVHHSQVHNLVVVVNLGDGITLNTTLPTSVSPASTDSEFHDNEFHDNVVIDNRNNGITVNGGSNNLFIHNNLSGNEISDGLLLSKSDSNVVRWNTVDSNLNGIVVDGSMNRIEHNTALGNRIGLDLQDLTNCAGGNIWTGNSFDTPNPPPPCFIP